MFSGVLDQANAMDAAEAERFAQLLRTIGGETAFSLAPIRQMERRDNVLVLS